MLGVETMKMEFPICLSCLLIPVDSGKLPGPLGLSFLIYKIRLVWRLPYKQVSGIDEVLCMECSAQQWADRTELSNQWLWTKCAHSLSSCFTLLHARPLTQFWF